MKTLILTLTTVSLVLVTAHAQQDMLQIEPNSPRPYAEQSGQLFTVGISLATGELTVKAIGNSIADTDYSDLTVFGRTFDLLGKQRDLNIVRAGDHFKIIDGLGDSSQLEIQVRNPKKHQNETIKIIAKPATETK